MIKCRDLLSLSTLAKAKVVSGHSGLDNGIRWVYKPENMNFSKWVRGRELMIVSTPVINSKDFDLFKLVKEAVRINMSGALLLVGESYINKISRQLVNYTDENKFPILVISGETPLIDIFEEIGHVIAYNDNSNQDNEDVLSSIIFGQDIDVEALRMKSEMIGYNITPPQQIFVLNLVPASQLEIFDKDVISNKVIECFSEFKINIVSSHYGNNFVGMFHVFDNFKKVMEEVFDRIEEEIQKEYPGVKIKMGIGKSYENLELLKESFKEASKCIVNVEKMGKESGIFYHSDFLFFNMISELDNRAVIDEFIEDTIGKIIQYDKDNNTELLLTLKYYINCNCSLIHSAEKLHTHKNTVKYRIKRIEEITGQKLEDCITRMKMMNAILCKELCC